MSTVHMKLLGFYLGNHDSNMMIYDGAKFTGSQNILGTMAGDFSSLLELEGKDITPANVLDTIKQVQKGTERFILVSLPISTQMRPKKFPRAKSKANRFNTPEVPSPPPQCGSSGAG